MGRGGGGCPGRRRRNLVKKKKSERVFFPLSFYSPRSLPAPVNYSTYFFGKDCYLCTTVTLILQN